jgi:hypothetical protein
MGDLLCVWSTTGRTAAQGTVNDAEEASLCTVNAFNIVGLGNVLREKKSEVTKPNGETSRQKSKDHGITKKRAEAEDKGGHPPL